MRKKEILPFTTIWVKPEGVVLNKSDTEREILCGITYLWNVKATFTEIESGAARGGGVGAG